jgi:hypothetical protein
VERQLAYYQRGRPGVESLIKLFCAKGYSEFAPWMLGVVEVSCQSQCKVRKCVVCMSMVKGCVFLYMLSLFIYGYSIVEWCAQLRYVISME